MDRMNTWARRSGRGVGRRGFTLIELLVVVSIIALLISILLPSLAKARQQAAALACSANERSLMQGLNTYLAEWDGVFPPNGIIFPKAGNGPNSVTDQQKYKPEFGAMFPMVNKNLKVYMCPTDFNNHGYRTNVGSVGNTALVQNANGVVTTLADLGTASNGGYWSYSVNTVLNSEGRFRQQFDPVPWADPLKVVNIRRPSDFVAMAEEGEGSDFNDEVFEPPTYQTLKDANLLTNRHNGMGNIGYMDAHVEPYNAVSFNNALPANGDGSPTEGPMSLADHQFAMTQRLTRNFFPDFGAFADQ